MIYQLGRLVRLSPSDGDGGLDVGGEQGRGAGGGGWGGALGGRSLGLDRKSTRLNSSHL